MTDQNADHERTAETLLRLASLEENGYRRGLLLAEAQVHATLALASEQAIVSRATTYARRTMDEMIAEAYAPGREPGGYLRWRDTQAMAQDQARARAAAADTDADENEEGP